MNSAKAAIRRACADDVEAIVALNAALFREDSGERDPFMNAHWPGQEGDGYFGTLVQDQASLALIADSGRVPVGYLVARLHEADTLRPVRTAELESMYVLADARDHGVGGQLVAEFLDWARGRGAQRVAVTAYAANDRAVCFYRRCGFAPKSLTLDAAL